jgi:transcriptional regulator with XRE-family HTH domain
MESTSNSPTKIKGRDLHYYRQRYKNRFASKLFSFYEEESKRKGISKKTIADRLGKDPAQISRWLLHPSNLTLETVSDLLLALDAEAEPPAIVRFSERAVRNYAHPVIARFLGNKNAPETTSSPKIDNSGAPNSFGAKGVTEVSKLLNPVVA